MHRLPLKVTVQRTPPIWTILQRLIPIRTKRTRKDTNIPKHALERFIQYITHLIFEILAGGKRRSEEKWTSSTCINGYFTTGSTDTFVLVETFPEFVNWCAGGFRSYVEEDTDVWLNERAEGIEEPALVDVR